jgi:citrate lyase beta subunit
VANQLGLYIGDDDDMGFEPDVAIANSPTTFAGMQGKLRTFAAFRKSKEAEDWARLLGDHLVRRTRTYIRKNFAKKENGKEYLTFADGTKFFFPERKSIVKNHSFGDDDPAVKMASPLTISQLERLKLPRNALLDYIDLNAFTESAEDQAFLKKVQRARGNLLGIARSSFLKRLSSGGHPFILSLRRHLARNLAWIYALENTLDIPIGASSTSELDEFDLLDESDLDDPFDESNDEVSSAKNAYEIIQRGASPQISWVRPSLFQPNLKTVLQHDNQIIQDLLESFGVWNFEKDSKLQSLIELVTNEHPDQKILIFTEYRDTALYLGEAFAAAGIKAFEVVTSDTSDPTGVAARFSPKSNTPLGSPTVVPENPLRILVTTDVLSEGQNLQDSHIVVNFDLPWAIIKLVQRAGRIDRVGQEASEVLVYSFFHDEVEPVLNLRSAIRTRLKNIAQTIGNDEKFFGDKSETNAIEELEKGKVPDEEEDDVDAVSKAYEVWRKLESEQPELARRIATLPALVYSTRARREGDNADCVAYARTANQVNIFGVADYEAEEESQIRTISEVEALRMLESNPEIATLSRLPMHFQNVDLVAFHLAEASQTGYGQLDWVRRNIIEKLKNNPGEKLSSVLDDIRQRPLTSHADGILNRAIRSKKPKDALELLVLSLEESGQLTLPIRDNDESLELVVSLGISR